MGGWGREKIEKWQRGKNRGVKGLSSRNVAVDIEREKQRRRHGKMNRLLRGERCNLALQQIKKDAQLFFLKCR